MPPDPGTVDLSTILSVCRSGDTVNSALVGEIVGHFIEQNRQRLADARVAADAGDRGALVDIAHAIVGSAGIVGARRLSVLAQSLERDARTLDANALGNVVEAVGAEFSEVVSALREHV